MIFYFAYSMEDFGRGFRTTNLAAGSVGFDCGEKSKVGRCKGGGKAGWERRGARFWWNCMAGCGLWFLHREGDVMWNERIVIGHFLGDFGMHAADSGIQ